ncbi:MAG: ABC transporter ATP-binding protein [Bacilli bacterium]|jgi:ATP-binding cassette subfamily B protein|nr:ABC transporter ATP-binding protein [Bacilli bacterium]MDY0064047.1 ABC transporter ATP-binding protein [Bacilli bacterium]
MIKIIRYFKWWYWILILIIVGFIYLQVSLDLLLPEYMNKIINYIGINYSSGIDQTSNILLEGLKMTGISFVSISATVVASFIATRIGAATAKEVRRAMYEKVNSFSMEEMEKFSTSSLITRSTNDVQQVQMVIIIALRMAITAPIMATKAIIKIWGISSEMSFIVGIGIFGIIFLIGSIFVFALPKFKMIQKQIDQLNLVTRENLTGIRVVRAYNAEEFEQHKFEKANHDLTKTNLHVGYAMGLMMPGMQLIMSGVNLAIVWFGAFLINKGTLGNNPIQGVALLMEFTTYATHIVISFMFLTMMFIMMPRASVSGKRIMEVLDIGVKVKNPLRAVDMASRSEKGTIVFENVSFRYPRAEACVLNNISFQVKQGETIAFVGSTGSGKSTLLNLVPRFYDVTEGKVLVDGIDVRDYNQEDLHQLLGYVPQQGILFRGDITSNIRFGQETITEEEINKALEIAQAMEFVEKLDEKLDYQIAQSGKNVSGGQKQRLCIARAIARKPEIYIFDDSFSALDYKTDYVLRRALKKETKSATNLIVASRIGTILDADKIVVLEKGEIVGIGTHQELLKTCRVYQEMATSQLSMEELNYAN